MTVCNARTLDEIQGDTGPWADRTFPASTVESVVAHLKAEFREFADCPSRDEAADIVLLLCSYAHKSRFSLLEAVERKLAINKGRTWKTTLEPGGYQRHEDVPGQLLLECVSSSAEGPSGEFLQTGSTTAQGRPS